MDGYARCCADCGLPSRLYHSHIVVHRFDSPCPLISLQAQKHTLICKYKTTFSILLSTFRPRAESDLGRITFSSSPNTTHKPLYMTLAYAFVRLLLAPMDPKMSSNTKEGVRDMGAGRLTHDHLHSHQMQLSLSLLAPPLGGTNSTPGLSTGLGSGSGQQAPAPVLPASVSPSPRLATVSATGGTPGRRFYNIRFQTDQIQYLTGVDPLFSNASSNVNVRGGNTKFELLCTDFDGLECGSPYTTIRGSGFALSIAQSTTSMSGKYINPGTHTKSVEMVPSRLSKVQVRMVKR